MALTNALNWGEPIPTQARILEIIDSLSHTYAYGCKHPNGHPSIQPFNNIGSRGLAITMMVNEPISTAPNAIFTADGILITKPIPTHTQIEAFYGLNMRKYAPSKATQFTPIPTYASSRPPANESASGGRCSRGSAPGNAQTFSWCPRHLRRICDT
jgi:hypothetical protein